MHEPVQKVMCSIFHRSRPVHLYVWRFGPQNPGDLDAILNFAKMYKNAPEGFVLRNDRPKVMRAGILGRFPPIETTSELVSTLEKS